MQVDSVALDVKLKLIVPGNHTPVAKRIPAKLTYDQLMAKAKALASKHGLLDSQDPVITYKDETEWANLEVEDDDDLELALAKAVTSDSKSITFFIKTSKSIAQIDSQSAASQSKQEMKSTAASVADPEDEEMKGDGDDEAPVKGK